MLQHRAIQFPSDQSKPQSQITPTHSLYRLQWYCITQVKWSDCNLTQADYTPLHESDWEITGPYKIVLLSPNSVVDCFTVDTTQKELLNLGHSVFNLSIKDKFCGPYKPLQLCVSVTKAQRLG